jgi:hypothetical protein
MKLYFQKSLSGLILLSLAFISVSCDDLLDINHSPNVPTFDQRTNQVLFATGELATTGKVGGDLNILGGMYGEYVTQSAFSNQYKYIDAYDIKSTDFNASWDILYSDGLKNYKFVMDKSKADQDWSYYLMAAVMNAYTTAVLVDLYDKLPYFEALQGKANLQPHFDDGFTIYKDLIAKIDTALGKDFSAPTNSVPGTAPSYLDGTPGFVASDILFKGNIDKWKIFANTLKLKLYLRMVNAQPTLAHDSITAMINRGTEFLTEDAAVTNFTNVLGKDNPFYEQNIRGLNTTDNIRASRTFASWLIANDDPRAITYFGASNPASINQGDFNGTDATYSASKVLVQSPTEPVVFISKAESYFLQSEAKVRYYGGVGAQDLYNQGVLASFTATGNDGSSFVEDGGVYAFPVSGDTEQKIEAIIVQKWASFPYGCHMLEGYLERNRTGYPKSSSVYSTDSNYIPGQFVISKNSVLPAGKFPRRLVFPYDETSRNANAPDLVPATTPVWWAKQNIN